MELKRCSKCVMPETQDIITFDAEGVCSTCRNVEIKQEKIDWAAKERKFLDLAAKYKGQGQYDCIIPFSGGKDSTFAAWAAVKKYGLKPLIVSFDHHMMRPRVLANTQRTVKRLGVDILRFKANWQLIKKMMRVSLERKGDILWYQHVGIFVTPMQMALRFNIPLIIWGEPSAEYQSYYSYDENEEVDERRFNMFINLGITAEDMFGMLGDKTVTWRDMAPYIYPSRDELRKLGCRSICLGSYIPWDVKKQVEIIKREVGWEGDEVEGVPPEYNYEKIEDMMQGVQDYLKYIKRGYGRMSHLASIDIRNGRLTRDKGLHLVKEWEGMRPASLNVLLQWLKMSEDEFYAIARKHMVSPWVHDPSHARRGKELWDQKLWIIE